MKTGLRGNFIAFNVYIRKEERSKINGKTSTLENQKKRAN